jgi:hypothetical protein
MHVHEAKKYILQLHRNNGRYVVITCPVGSKYSDFMDERKTNLLYIFIVAVGDALHVSGVFAHRQER